MPITFQNFANLQVGLWLEAGAHNPEVVLDPGGQENVDLVGGEVVFQVRSAPNVGQPFNVTYLPSNQPGYTLPDAGTVGITSDGANLMVSDGLTGMLFVR